MKKAISLTFLLLASLIMLAHAAIPHHHHNQIPFELITHNHEHSDATHDHHHHDDTMPVEHNGNSHGHNVIEDCLLEKTYTIVGKDKQAFQFLASDFNLLPCLLTLFSVNPITKITDLEGLPFRQNPYLLSHHTEFISQSLGLRAPPVC